MIALWLTIVVLAVITVFLFAVLYGKLERITCKMALGQAELEAAVAAVEGDVEKIVVAIHDARTQIDALTKEVADLVAAGDTTGVVDRLKAIDSKLDEAVPDTAPTP